MMPELLNQVTVSSSLESTSAERNSGVQACSSTAMTRVVGALIARGSG
jgi:hypothetical protein